MVFRCDPFSVVQRTSMVQDGAQEGTYFVFYMPSTFAMHCQNYFKKLSFTFCSISCEMPQIQVFRTSMLVN